MRVALAQLYKEQDLYCKDDSHGEPLLFSLVVPVYKVPEDMLEDCLSSISGQDYASMEAIVIDDGSPDACGEICDRYAEIDSRIRVFHVQNGGVSAARNLGIQHASGKYVMFVDGDDYLPAGFLRKLSEKASTSSADIIQYCYTRKVDGRVLSEIPVERHVELKGSVDIAEAIIRGAPAERGLGIPSVLYGTPWGRVYLRSFLDANDLRFPLGIVKRQDAIFAVATHAKNPRQEYLGEVGYIYVENEESTCNKYNPDASRVMWDAYQCMKACIEDSYSENALRRLRISYPTLAYSFLRDALRIGILSDNCPMSAREARACYGQEYGMWKSEVVHCDGKYVPKLAKLGLWLYDHDAETEYILLRQLKNRMNGIRAVIKGLGRT